MIADVRDALLDGQSWSVIGRRIGKSKNSMSGLISRHVYPRYPGLQAELAIIRPPVGGRPKGMPKGPPKVARPRRPPSLHAPKTVVPKRAPEPALVVAPEPQVRQCQWPTTRGRRHEFLCADTAVLGYPYCDRHCGVAYNNWRRLP
jgi:GcrA cell cycle regulator